jgi:hypothetical protein
MEARHGHEVAADGADVLIRLSAIAAVAVVVALAVAGCGSSKSKQAAAKPVSSALIVNAASKSVRSGSVEADFKLAGSGVNGSGSGVFNTGPSRSGQLSMKIQLQSAEVPIDSVITGNVLYIRSPALTQQLGLSQDKQWLKLDLGQLAQQRGIDLSSLANASPTPASALLYLRGAGNVQEVGHETVDGVDTTHYRVTVDLEQAAARSNGSERESLRRVIQTSGAKKLPIGVWVDADGYVRKVRYAQREAAGRSVVVTMNLHDYGAPVTIKPPPADTVVDASKALGAG